MARPATLGCKRGAILLLLAGAITGCTAILRIDKDYREIGETGVGGAGGSASQASSSAGGSTSQASSSGVMTGSSTSNSSSSGAPPVCGNSVMEPGEQCDDGNKAAGDGCSPMCLTEHPEVCPGTAISLVLGQMVVINGDTQGASDKFVGMANVGNCNSGPWPGSDLIYAVTPSTPGKLTATLAATYTSPCLHIRTQCPGGMQDEIACQASTNAGINMVTIQVTAGTVYYVAADSWSGNSGGFKLTLALQ